MDLWVWGIAAIITSYVIGSIPTGLWLGLRLRGIDIREHGSRNIGATNTLRVLGKKLGAVALIGDMLKGIVSVALGLEVAGMLSNIRNHVVYAGDNPIPLVLVTYLPLACGLAAILGHSFSIFLRFKGGKGVATSTGVFAALLPIPVLIGAIVFGITFWRTRMVSMGSMLGAVTVAIAVFFVDAMPALRVIAVLVALLIIYRHRDNIRRIMQGNENRL